MPVPVPNLDDRTYDDLVAEALRLIPSVAPEWTDHNPSDPGITLIEMLAYVTEMLIYRVNRITEPNTIAFLRLLKGAPQWQPSKSVKDELRETMQDLRTEKRAVTPSDFVRHAEAVRNEDGKKIVARAHCLPRRNLEAPDRLTERPGHVSIIVVPEADAQEELGTLIARVRSDLEPRCLITTRLHVTTARQCSIRVYVTVNLKPDAVDVLHVFDAETSMPGDLEPQKVIQIFRSKIPEDAAVPEDVQISALPGIGDEWLIWWWARDMLIFRVVPETLFSEHIPIQETTVTGKILRCYRDLARERIVKALQDFGDAWPFGRAVYVSEIYALIDRLDIVDFVEQTGDNDELIGDDDRRLWRDDGHLVGIRLEPDEIVTLSIDPSEITVRTPGVEYISQGGQP